MHEFAITTYTGTTYGIRVEALVTLPEDLNEQPSSRYFALKKKTKNTFILQITVVTGKLSL